MPVGLKVRLNSVKNLIIQKRNCIAFWVDELHTLYLGLGVYWNTVSQCNEVMWQAIQAPSLRLRGFSEEKNSHEAIWMI